MKSARQWQLGHWTRGQRDIGFCALLPVLGLLAAGCGAVPDAESEQPVRESASSLAFQSGFKCGKTDQACTDIYAFELPGGVVNEVTIQITRSQVPIRLGAFAPGVSPITGTNLLTGNGSDYRCSSLLPLTKTFRTSGPGIYLVALSQDPTTDAARKDYQFEVTANNTLTRVLSSQQTAIKTARPATCRFAPEISGTWKCAAGVNCQDVYDIGVLPNSTLTVEVHPSGVSAGRLAVFEMFEPLNGKNLLTGVSKDFNCFQRSPLEIRSVVARSGGHYKIAFGRDAALSLTPPPFTYTASISVATPADNSAFTPDFVGRVVNDQPSQATGIQCGIAP